MRKRVEEQLVFGQVDISQIKFDSKSRDDIPQVLRGLQHIYSQPDIRNAIFQILEENVLPESDKGKGRPGMELWKILVMGVLRLNLNWDYDRLHEMVNHHATIRQILGHTPFDQDTKYNLQTIKDNISLLTVEILQRINEIVIECAHEVVKKKANMPLRARCDSFVVKTNVHYPTDITLLYDAIRKVITITGNECQKQNIPGWRQYKYMIKRIKKLLRRIQKLKHSNSRRVTKKLEKELEIAGAYRNYIKIVQKYIERAETIRNEISASSNPHILESIDYFIQHAKRQIDQIIGRVLHRETIPHQEKVFSVFQPHTEWICKGKAGVPVELGLRVAIVEDRCGFLLNHRVMEKQTDDRVVQSLIAETKQCFPRLYSCSFDKAFHSPDNQKVLNQTLDIAALPRKGRLSKVNAEHEQSEAFLTAKKKHSAVESAINALEVHGLDRCPDHGLDGFKRYVALAILSRNLQIIGAILAKREKRRLQRQYQLAA